MSKKIKSFLKKNTKKNIKHKKKSAFKNVGRVNSVFDGVAQVNNLKCRIGEIVVLGSGFKIKGIVLSIEKHFSSIAVLGSENLVSQGTIVKGTGGILSIPFGPKLLGCVVDSLGHQLDSNVESKYLVKLGIESKAPGICTRVGVYEPMHTGIKVIDSLIPIGRGQKELIIGDRQTGKTSIALTTIVNQRYETQDLFSVYVASGQRRSVVSQIVTALKKKNILHRTVIVAATASESPALQYLAPYAGCSIGERFRDSGFHSVVIYDDLTKQAIAYRQMSLILRKPPGREAYPGDVFYLHSKLLERAAKMNRINGLGSLTALPIIETQASDVSAYIATNVISITDGQIFLQPDLFVSDIKPAVDVNLSVSRVGNAAQLKSMNIVSKGLKVQLAEFRNLSYFLSFNPSFDKETMDSIERGYRLVELLKQDYLRVYSPDLQILLIFLAMNGYFDTIKVSNIKNFKDYVIFNLSFLEKLLNFKSENLMYKLNFNLLNLIAELTVNSYPMASSPLRLNI